MGNSVSGKAGWTSALLAGFCLTVLVPAIGSAQRNADHAEAAGSGQAQIEKSIALRHWNDAVEPQKIVGPIYFVGTRGLGAYLITTPKGHILLNTAMPSAGPMIADSIRKLGFRVEDVRFILCGHAHIDHVGAIDYMKRLSHAQLAVMREDVPSMEDGGKSDFNYGSETGGRFTPVKVDRVLRDGSTIRLGGIVMHALHTPGHTPGATTWTTSVRENGRIYKIVWAEGFGVNPGYRLFDNAAYPHIVQDFRGTLDRLEKLKPDIFLSSHTEVFDFENKSKRSATIGTAAFVDPAGYRKMIAGGRAQFDREYDRQLAKTKSEG